MINSRYNPTRRALIFWTLFIGIGAVAGSVEMLADPTGKAMGMDALLPFFKKLPFYDLLFKNYIFSGIALLIVNGITNLTALVLLILKRRSGIVLGTVFGITLMLWICIQFYMFPINFMSTIFFIFGAIQAATGYAAYVFERQESFSVNENGYPNIGTEKQRLVVYFSRMGYVKKAALEEANRTGAYIYEIKTDEKTDGTLGFWWCGRYGMHAWDMPILPIGIDLTRFDHITICSPIWVFGLSAPVRAFCRQSGGKIKEADYILVHHQRAPYFNAAKEMDMLLGLKNSPAKSICCRRGKYLSEKHN